MMGKGESDLFSDEKNSHQIRGTQNNLDNKALQKLSQGKLPL